MTNIVYNRITDFLKYNESFTRDDLYKFYLASEPNLQEGTFGWRIYDLKNRNVIKPIKRGKYLATHKPEFKPEISKEVQKLVRQISAKYNEINHCIWETCWLNEFTKHQTNKSLIIIEIEKGFEESLYYELKDKQRKELFLNPDEKVIEFYITESSQPVIVKKIITRSPLIARKEFKTKFFTPALEKILVDLFSDKKLYYFIQGTELVNIFQNAISNYSINYTKLLSYAKRREKMQDIIQFLTNNMNHLVKDVVND